MKRYLLFVGEYYYPWGAMEDFVRDFDTYDECKEAYDFISKYGHRYYGVEWWNILDTEIGAWTCDDEYRDEDNSLRRCSEYRRLLKEHIDESST